MAPVAAKTRRKQFTLDAALLGALEALAREEGAGLDTLADAAFRELLKSKGRPVTLKDALKASARTMPANDPAPAAGSKSLRKRSAPKQ